MNNIVLTEPQLELITSRLTTEWQTVIQIGLSGSVLREAARGGYIQQSFSDIILPGSPNPVRRYLYRLNNLPK